MVAPDAAQWRLASDALWLGQSCAAEQDLAELFLQVNGSLVNGPDSVI